MTIRLIRIEGDIAYVPLTKGYEAIIDAVDVPMVSGWNWYAVVRPHTVYAQRSEKTNGERRSVLMHRAVMGEPFGFEIDHCNGNGLDNRRSINLRLATPAQNMYNQRLSRANSSGFKGVSLHKASGCWRARIGMNRKKYLLGYYKTPELAHKAYVLASAKLHGQFGRAA